MQGWPGSLASVNVSPPGPGQLTVIVITFPHSPHSLGHPATDDELELVELLDFELELRLVLELLEQLLLLVLLELVDELELQDDELVLDILPVLELLLLRLVLLLLLRLKLKLELELEKLVDELLLDDGCGQDEDQGGGPDDLLEVDVLMLKLLEPAYIPCAL